MASSLANADDAISDLLGVIAAPLVVPLSIDVAGGVAVVEDGVDGVEGVLGYVPCEKAVPAASAPPTNATARVSCRFLSFMMRLLCVPDESTPPGLLDTRQAPGPDVLLPLRYFRIAASPLAAFVPFDDVFPFAAPLAGVLAASSRSRQAATSPSGRSAHALIGSLRFTASLCRFPCARFCCVAGACCVAGPWLDGAFVPPEGMMAGLGSGTTGTVPLEGSELCAFAVMAV